MKEVLKMIKGALTMRTEECSILERKAYGEKKRTTKPKDLGLLEARTYGHTFEKKIRKD